MPRSLLVAFSGGLDSVVLLDALHRWCEKMPYVATLSAAHVHHGLSPNADAWLAFCERFCAERGIAFTARRLTLPQKPQTSLEETARLARHAALREIAGEMGADAIALAHHQDDQVETLLLQLLRGAGPQGLAAMAEYLPSPDQPPFQRGCPSKTGGGLSQSPSNPPTPAPFPKRVSAKPAGVCCPQGGEGVNPAFWRPLLSIPRTALLAYARTHKLEWIEDESNTEIGFKRNFLRHRIFPVLEEAFPAYRKTLSRAAALQAETAVLLTELAGVHHKIDVAKARFPLDSSWLAALPEALARHALRIAFRQVGLRAPTFARLNEMLRQLRHARPDAQIELRHGARCLGVYRGKIMLYTPVSPYKILWRGEEHVTLPHGVLHLKPGKECDFLRDALGRGKEILIASRLHEQEYLKPAANRPRRLLCDWLREAGIPHWERDAWPRIYCDEGIVFVPGIGRGEADEAWLSFLRSPEQPPE
ncbi:MAG: tRNA lysidine(34) synthetase TilS [Proteobacteria bacterium]|nr:tRNA lysidine(34) synthetase TilS [Pseudomonadota bacterium]